MLNENGIYNTFHGVDLITVDKNTLWELKVKGTLAKC